MIIGVEVGRPVKQIVLVLAAALLLGSLSSPALAGEPLELSVQTQAYTTKLKVSDLPVQLRLSGGRLSPGDSGQITVSRGAAGVSVTADNGLLRLTPGEHLPARFFIPESGELTDRVNAADRRLLAALEGQSSGWLMLRVERKGGEISLHHRHFPDRILDRFPERFRDAPERGLEDRAREYFLGLSADPSSLPADGESEAVVTARVLDEHGLPVTGAPLTLTQTAGFGNLLGTESRTGEDGTVEATLQAGETARANVVEARLPGGQSKQLEIPQAVTGSVKLKLVSQREFDERDGVTLFRAPNEIELEVFPDEIPADGSSVAQVSATLTSPTGEPLPGVELSASVVGGSGTIEPVSEYTNSNGVQEFIYTASREPGSAKILVTDGGGAQATAQITLYQPGAAELDFALDGTTVPPDKQGFVVNADGGAIELTVTVTDLGGNPVADRRVNFSTGSSLGSVEVIDPVTDGSGEVRVRFYPNGRTGVAEITAFLDSVKSDAGTGLSLN